MSKVYVLLADGFEEIEGLTVVDLLRRAGIEVVLASIKDTTDIKGARGINVVADELLSDIKDSADMVVLPGGGSSWWYARNQLSKGESGSS